MNTCLDPGADDIPASVEEWTGGAGVPVAFGQRSSLAPPGT
jgi:hypothetical protein